MDKKEKMRLKKIVKETLKSKIMIPVYILTGLLFVNSFVGCQEAIPYEAEKTTVQEEVVEDKIVDKESHDERLAENKEESTAANEEVEVKSDVPVVEPDIVTHDNNLEKQPDEVPIENPVEKPTNPVVEIVWTENDGAVWTKDELNIRSGPSTDYDIVGQFQYGEEVHRLAVGDNNWAKIDYDGEVRYVSNNYLTENKPQPKTDGASANEEIANRVRNETDLVGVLFMPSINNNPIDLIRPQSYPDVQMIADNTKTAYCISMVSNYDETAHRVEIGDHNNQYFENLNKVQVGDMAYINMGNRVMRLKCSAVEPNGDPKEYNMGIRNDRNSICMLTCSDDGRTRVIVRWKTTEDTDVSFDELFDIPSYYFTACRDY